MRGKVRRELYEYDNGTWRLLESETEKEAIIDYSHWKSWKDFEKNSYLKCSNSEGKRVMDTYITYSPSKTQKVIYRRIK